MDDCYFFVPKTSYVCLYCAPFRKALATDA